MNVTLPKSPYDLHPALRAFCLAILLIEVAFSGLDQAGMSLRQEAGDLLALTFNWRPEPYRVAGHIFLHGDLWHMLFNLVFILIFGDALTLLRGMAETAVMVVVSVLAGAAGFLVFGIYPAMIGSSAIAFGVTAACMIDWRHLTAFHKALAICLAATVPASIFLWTGIAWEAHVAAIVAGIVVAMVFRVVKWQG